ncbi:MAG: outer membrane lipoprotein-sorting protein [Candidatus Zixiibacteriota bacterium]|nr:MAG: outer membrane lipoprotein-sorting protein [candidate division Zixibacteria bacterium]
MKIHRTLTIIAIILITWSASVSAEDNQAEEIMKKAHLALFYAGDDGSADVVMTIVNSKGKERMREFTMLRLDLEDGGKQFYYTYFRKPHDVSRLTFMVHKVPFETDSRWLYIPAVDLVKRISADDKNSSFVGSDFTYEDVSGRHWSEDNHKLLRTDILGGRDVHVIESIPEAGHKGFSRKVSFIDAKHFLPLKEEYYDKKGEMERVYTAELIEDIEGIRTPTLRKMENVKKNQYTVVEFTNISYNVGLKDNIFTERYLKNPPREYIK